MLAIAVGYRRERSRHVHGYAAFCRQLLVCVSLLLSWTLNTAQLSASAVNPGGGLRTEDHVHAAVRRAARESDSLLITLRIDPGYHVNANPASNEYLIPTSAAVTGAVPERIVYPPALRFKPAFAEEPIDVYGGTVVITVTRSSGRPQSYSYGASLHRYDLFAARRNNSAMIGYCPSDYGLYQPPRGKFATREPAILSR